MLRGRGSKREDRYLELESYSDGGERASSAEQGVARAAHELRFVRVVAVALEAGGFDVGHD